MNICLRRTTRLYFGTDLFCTYSNNISLARANDGVYIYDKDLQIKFSLTDFNVTLTNEMINAELIKIPQKTNTRIW